MNKVEMDQAYETMDALQAELHRSAYVRKDDMPIYVGSVCLESSVLLDGNPSVGKTRIARSLATAVSGDFSRIQGSPDLMPSDITGNEIFRNGDFVFRQGPIFSNVVLADEINRNQTKTQAGLLEAMEEKQVTVGNTTYELPRPFVVLATQNPLELGQATNPLTRAQLDRFAASIDIEDLEVHEMDAIDALLESGHKTEPVVDLKDITQAKEAILNVTVPQEEKQRASRIVVALRELGIVDRSESVLGGYRPKMHIVNLAKGVALLDRRQTVKSEDIDAVTPYVLRHRTVLTDRETDKGTPVKVAINQAIKNSKS